MKSIYLFKFDSSHHFWPLHLLLSLPTFAARYFKTQSYLHIINQKSLNYHRPRKSTTVDTDRDHHDTNMQFVCPTNLLGLKSGKRKVTRQYSWHNRPITGRMRLWPPTIQFFETCKTGYLDPSGPFFTLTRFTLFSLEWERFLVLLYKR